MNRVAISQRGVLLDKLQSAGVRAGCRRVGRLIARPHHHANLLQAGLQDLLDDDGQGRFGGAIPIDQ